MNSKKYILSIDQGTTGTTALVVNQDGDVCGQGYRGVKEIYPTPGWVDQDPVELFESCEYAILEAFRNANVHPSECVSLGITNQRETTLVWEKETGTPVSNAIVWECRRTSTICEELISKGLNDEIRNRTGLPIDAYFSATKLRWILDHIPEGQVRAQRGELLFGTVDTWIIWNLTRGRNHVTDITNASRTMMLNLHTKDWDDLILDILEIPRKLLPEIQPSAGIFGDATLGLFEESSLPISGVIGDQQSALFGQGCISSGSAKNTYGTGSFLLLNTGEKLTVSTEGLITIPAWGIDSEITYALEGSIFSTGAAVQWLKDGLGIIEEIEDVETLASSVSTNGGVFVVPAFSGLGAPYWDMYARGSIFGLTRGSNSGHISRATLESIAFQSRDVLESMQKDFGQKIATLRVDGGGSENRLLMQMQADILGVPMERSSIIQSTGLGAANMAGISVGFWGSIEEVANRWRSDVVFEPGITIDEREDLYSKWKIAVSRASDWADE